MLRKLAIAVPLVLATAAVLWAGLNLPPPLWILTYGPTPGCEPEGVKTAAGVEFVVLGPGYCRIGSNYLAEEPDEEYFRRTGYTHGDLLGRVASPVGLPRGRPPKRAPEMPVRWIEFPRGFAIATTEVTNAQYERFDPHHDRDEHSDGDEEPVVGVSWGEAREFCDWLAEAGGIPIRLPTEAEWETACRAGSRTEYPFALAEHLQFAWSYENSEARAHAVGVLRPNAWGLHDMSGNVWEWCADGWRDTLVDAPTDGSVAADAASPSRVRRGGGWGVGIHHCRAARRSGERAGSGRDYLGFRPAFTPPER